MCVQAVEGSASPLCILLYAATLPRYVVAQLKEMLVEEVRCADDHNKVNTDSPLLNWQKVQDPTDNDDVNEEYLKTIQELYTGWISCCDKIVDKVEKLMLEDDSRREGSNPVVLLRRWCNIPSRGGKMELGKIIEEESYLHGRLSTVCTGHVTISWKARIELYKLTLQNYPRFREKDTAFACFVGSLSDVSANIKDTQDLARAVQRLADSSGCSTVDEYLGFTQAEDTHGAGKKRGLSSPSSDEHRSHTDGKRQRFEQSKAPQKELASAKLGLPAEVVKSRFEAGVCLGCGQSGHRVRDCKNPVRGSSGVTVSSASAYSDRGVALMSLSASSMSALLTAPVKLINTNSSSEQYIAALAGFDTMSSVNLIDSDVTTRVECELVSETNTVRTIQGNVTAIARTLSLVRAIIARTRLRVCLGGYSADLSFAVVENLPAVQVLIGRPWLSELGVNVSLPEFATTTTPRGDIFSTLSSQIQGAREALIGRLDKPQRLPGANRYYGRIRRLRAPGSSEEPDHPDHPDQTMAYEVWWDSAVSHKNSQRPERPSVPVDFSVPLINKLTEAQQAQFRSELQTFIDNGWWKEVPVRGVKAEWEQSQLCDEPLSPLRHPAVSFPIIQKAHKSTRCRLVTDCRYCNTFLPPASYEGWGVTDCIAYIRANWKDSFSLAFLDLSKAFYKVHLGEGARLLILSDGRAFECGRLAFGLTHGPASLAGQVRELLNASLTGLLGRPVHCTSTREYVSLVPGLMILPYYDDIILCGLPNLCHRMASIMTSIAPLLGANFPREKTDWVEPSGDAVRHLGCLWSRSEDGGLCIQCLPPDEDRSSVSSPVSRRRIFQIAGALYDGVRLHPITRYVADKLRRWGGRSPYGNTRKGWDSQWAISDSCRENLNKLIAAGQSDDFGNCRHSSVPTHHRYILGFCDASESGWAFLVYTGSAIPKGSAPDLSASNPAFHLLEAHAGEWSDSNASSKWHINRKEAHTLSRCLQCVYDWLGRFLDPRDRFDTAVFCDNISALSWALETSKPSRSYDRTALERLSRSLNDLREQISRDYRLPIDLYHISGLHNYLADYLSRHPALELDLPPLGNSVSQDGPYNLPPAESNTQNLIDSPLTFLVVSAADECATVFDRGSSHKFADLEPIDICASPQSLHSGISLLTTEPDPLGDTSDPSQSPSVSDTLRGVADMTEDDVLLHVKEVLQDPRQLADVDIGGVPVSEILSSLGASPAARSVNSSLRADNLVKGSAHGPYFRWEDDVGLLFISDPLEKNPRWRIFLPDRRSRLWAIYQSHDHPFRGIHQGVAKALHALRHPTEGAAFWWPTIVADITRFIKGCKTCQMDRHYDLQNTQPLVRRRWRGRFEYVQLDFMKLRGSESPGSSLLSNEYYCVLIDEGTHVLRIVPTKSTSVQDAVSGVLDWIGTYGPPRMIQCDRAASHTSPEFDQFLRSWGIALQLGIARRPECQGLVERTIGEIKKICRLSHRLPLWAAAQVAVTVHNNALISGNAACTPNELALGLACPLDLPITENDGGSSTLSIAAGLHDYVSEAYSAFALRRSEEAFNAELRSVASTSPRFSFEPGDLVKLSRLVNGKREISGPFTVARRDPSNSFLYHLVDRSDPVSVSQLLPYHDVAERETYDFAIKPTQDRLSFSVKGKLPDGVELDELQKNKHWLLYRVEAAIEGDELTTKVYVAKFMRKMDDNDKFLVQGLDRQADGSFKLPPTRDRKRTQAVVSSEDILGGRGFLPTRGGWRIPRSVKAWFSDYGIDL